jgi:hypothetical protein
MQGLSEMGGDGRFSRANRARQHAARLTTARPSADEPAQRKALCATSFLLELKLRPPKRIARHRNYFSLAYSDLAAMRTGMSGSASFQSVKKSWYAARAFAASPCKT